MLDSPSLNGTDEGNKHVCQSQSSELIRDQSSKRNYSEHSVPKQSQKEHKNETEHAPAGNFRGDRMGTWELANQSPIAAALDADGVDQQLLRTSEARDEEKLIFEGKSNSASRLPTKLGYNEVATELDPSKGNGLSGRILNTAPQGKPLLGPMEPMRLMKGQSSRSSSEFTPFKGTDDNRTKNGAGSMHEYGSRIYQIQNHDESNGNGIGHRSHIIPSISEDSRLAYALAADTPESLIEEQLRRSQAVTLKRTEFQNALADMYSQSTNALALALLNQNSAFRNDISHSAAISSIAAAPKVNHSTPGSEIGEPEVFHPSTHDNQSAGHGRLAVTEKAMLIPNVVQSLAAPQQPVINNDFAFAKPDNGKAQIIVAESVPVVPAVATPPVYPLIRNNSYIDEAHAVHASSQPPQPPPLPLVFNNVVIPSDPQVMPAIIEASNVSTLPVPSNDRNIPPAQSVGRAYKCTHPGCNWSFMRSSDQKRHIRSHLEPSLRCPYSELEYSCNRKGGMFYRLDVLKRHLKLVHLNRPSDGTKEGGQCKVCAQYFELTREFIDHCDDCAKNALAKLSAVREAAKVSVVS